jgi:phage shock protein A
MWQKSFEVRPWISAENLEPEREPEIIILNKTMSELEKLKMQRQASQDLDQQINGVPTITIMPEIKKIVEHVERVTTLENAWQEYDETDPLKHKVTFVFEQEIKMNFW